MRRLLCLVAFLALPAQADFPLRYGNVRSLEVLRITSAHTDYWEDYVLLIGDASDVLARYAVSKCDTDHYDLWYRTPSLRTAIEEVIAYNRPTPAEAADPAYVRYKDRFLATAKLRLSAIEWTEFERHMADEEMLKLHASLSVLDDAPQLFMDPRTGILESAVVIWLKTYFEKEGRLDQLKKAMGSVDPKLPALIDKVKPIERHTQADDAALKAAFQSIFTNAKKIRDEYSKLHDAKLLAREVAFSKHPIHVHIRKIKWVETHPSATIEKALLEIKAKPRSSWTSTEAHLVDAVALKEIIARDYPMPPWLAKRRATMFDDPASIIGPKAAATICERLKNLKRG